MIGERTESALKRIDAAVARIEQASSRLGAKAGELAERNAQLTAASTRHAERHARLRAAVDEAMRDLDELIGRAGATRATVERAAEESAA